MNSEDVQSENVETKTDEAINTDNELKAKELKVRIAKLADKLVGLASDLNKFGPKKVREGLEIVGTARNGIFRHWHKMTLVSIRATRKKLAKLQEELKQL